MATKTYLTHRPNIALARPDKKADLYFVNGRLTTSNEDDQKFIEGLPSFKDETITLENPADVLAAAEAKAKALRAAADVAVKAAVEAEKAVAALSPKAEEKPKVEEPIKEPKAKAPKA